MFETKKYDVAIIGSGMGGSTLAAILARQGLDVIVFEAGQHPQICDWRFDHFGNIRDDARFGKVFRCARIGLF